MSDLSGKTDRELIIDAYKMINAVRESINELHIKVDKMSQTTNAVDQAVIALQAQVTQQVTVEQSAETLIAGIATQLQQAIAADNINPSDAPNIMAAVQQLQTSQTALAQAITANTPAPSSGGTTATPSSTNPAPAAS